MAAGEEFALRSETVGCLPIVNHFLARMGVGETLDAHLAGDARLRLSPATVIGVLVRNIVVSHRPLYAIAEWAAPHDPDALGLGPGESDALNDDRVGRMLDRLFDADRASVITAMVLRAIREFAVEVSQLHNDSTTVTVTGSYADADGRPRGGKTTPAICHGHNKDFRPDLLTELAGAFSLVRGSWLLARWVRVLARAHYQGRRAQASRHAERGAGGIVGLDRRPVRALSAA